MERKVDEVLSNIKTKIKIEDNGNNKRFSAKIELRRPGKHKFLLKHKGSKPIHFEGEESKGKLTGQDKKEKTVKRPTKIKRYAFFEKKKSKEKILDDHKTILPLSSGSDVEKPFKSPKIGRAHV